MESGMIGFVPPKIIRHTTREMREHLKKVSAELKRLEVETKKLAEEIYTDYNRVSVYFGSFYENTSVTITGINSTKTKELQIKQK